jgi:hypothetical protein
MQDKALILCLIAGLSFASASAATADDAVKFAFAWPSTFQADVVWTAHVVENSYGETKETKHTFEFGIVARPVADGIRIDQKTSIAQKLGNLVFNANSGAGGSLQHWLFAYPSFVVSTDGRFLRLEDVDAYRAGIAAMLTQIGKDSKKLEPQQAEQMHAFFEHALAPGVVGQRAALDWVTAIGSWIGGELRSGQIVELQRVLRYPMGTEVLEVPEVQRYRLIGRVPCDESAATQDCVDVEATFEPNSDALRAVYDRGTANLMQGLMPSGKEPPRFRSVATKSGLRMITEPQTLLPHRIVFVDEQHSQFVKPEQGYDTIDQRSEITIEFRYRR